MGIVEYSLRRLSLNKQKALTVNVRALYALS